jgi:hypothetical protein
VRVRRFLISVPASPPTQALVQAAHLSIKRGISPVAARWVYRNLCACGATWRARNGKLQNPVVGPVDDGLPLFWPECVSREFGEGEQFSA